EFSRDPGGRWGEHPADAPDRAPPTATDSAASGLHRGGDMPGNPVKSGFMAPRPGEELTEELETRQTSRLVRALEMVAPGTALREGIDHVLHARTGGLIVIGDPDELAFMFSGGIKLELDYSPAFLSERSKMDGAIVLSPNA